LVKGQADEAALEAMTMLTMMEISAEKSRSGDTTQPAHDTTREIQDGDRGGGKKLAERGVPRRDGLESIIEKKNL
jgi:hypothetical protein